MRQPGRPHLGEEKPARPGRRRRPGAADQPRSASGPARPGPGRRPPGERPCPPSPETGQRRGGRRFPAPLKEPPPRGARPRRRQRSAGPGPPPPQPPPCSRCHRRPLTPANHFRSRLSSRCHGSAPGPCRP